MRCRFHFHSAFCIKRKPTGTKYHKKDQANQNQNRYLQFHEVSDRKKTLRIVDKHDGSDQDRNLDQADDAGEQSYRNQRSTKNVCEDNVMSQCCTGEIDVQAGRSHFKVMHVRDEVQTFVGNEDSQSHPENVKKSGSVGVSPFFDVPDDTHKPMVLYIQS